MNSTLQGVEQLCEAHVIMSACIAEIPCVSDLFIQKLFSFL
jgi:hypothetical protein